MRWRVLPVLVVLVAIGGGVLLLGRCETRRDLPEAPGEGAAGPAAGPAHLEGRRAGAATGRVPRGEAARGSASPPPAARWEARGRVVVAHSDPPRGVAGVTVRLLLVRGPVREPVGEVVSAVDGSFHLALPRLDELAPTQIAPAGLHVYASGEGWMQWARRGGRRPDVVPLARAVSGRRVEISPQMTREKVARGRVLDARGRPVEDAAVRVKWVRSATGVREDDGWRHTDPAGEYHLRPWSACRAVMVRAHRHGVGSSLPVEVPLGAEGDAVALPDLVLAGDGIVAGRAEFADGSPAAGVDLWAGVVEPDEPFATRRGAQDACGRTDAAGRFVLRGLAEGRVRIRVGTLDPHGRPWPDAAVDARTADRDVVLGIDLPRVRIRVTDAVGLPVVGASYRASVEGAAGSAPADQWGRIRDDGTASVWTRPGAEVVVCVQASGLRPGEARVSVPPHLWSRDLDVVLRPWDAASFGRLRLEVGRTDAGAVGPTRLTLRTPVVRETLHGLPAARWSSGDAPVALPPGRWFLTLRPERGLVSPWAPQRHEIEVRPGEETTLRARLEQGGTVLVRVGWRGVRPAHPRVHVALEPEGHPGEPLSLRLGDAPSRGCRVAAGEWTVRARAPGIDPVTTRVRVETGGTVEAVLRLGEE